jgi:signal transduction histidine kinase
MSADWMAAVALVALVLVLAALVTGRWRRLQERISTIAREWQLTIDAVDFPILALDVDGRVVRMNRAAMLLAGKPYAETVGLRITDLGPGEPWRSAGKKLAELPNASGGTQSIDVRSAETGESWEILLRPVRDPGPSRPAFLVIARNTTEMKALQESLRNQEVMSALGSLVAGVAHEVRNPLFAISATVDALEARCGELIDLRPFLTILRGERDRLVSLTHDLLVYGKPVPPSLSPGPLGAVIEEACRTCAALAAENGVRIAVSGVEPGLTVARDAASLFLVFKNLIENAIQHSPRGAPVSVAAHWEGAWVECEVRDEGPGFRPDDIPLLFAPFFSRRRGGTGLGLSIAQRIVHEHGGEIVAANHADGGAVVRVRLPLLAGRA